MESYATRGLRCKAPRPPARWQARWRPSWLAGALAVTLAIAGCRAAETGAASPGDGVVERAFAARASGVEVEVTGEVARVLKDDREGSQHQRFLVRLPSGHSVLVAHNTDLAPRAPVAPGSRVTVHGEFEWNPKGGVIHWTHRDPRRSHPDGFILVDGRRYQ